MIWVVALDIQRDDGVTVRRYLRDVVAWTTFGLVLTREQREARRYTSPEHANEAVHNARLAKSLEPRVTVRRVRLRPRSFQAWWDAA